MTTVLLAAASTATVVVIVAGVASIGIVGLGAMIAGRAVTTGQVGPSIGIEDPVATPGLPGEAMAHRRRAPPARSAATPR